MKQKKSILDRIQIVAITMLIVADIALAAACWAQDRQREAEAWIGTIPMANQHIEWTWAGRETK